MNPKDRIGSAKVPLDLFPSTAIAVGAMAMLEGACKYGRNNWRVTPIQATEYLNALGRHVHLWKEGERSCPKSGVHHLGHALACLALIVDAEYAGTLIDDRPYQGGFVRLMKELEPDVARIRAEYADRNPKHYTRQTQGWSDYPGQRLK